MSLEQAARAEAERRWPDDPDHTIMAVRHMKRAGFEEAASWLAEHLLSDESVERAARTLYASNPIKYSLSTNYDKVGEPKPWESLNDATRATYLERARAALTAALGTNHNEQEQSNG